MDNLYLVEHMTEIFDSWSFIANTTDKNVLSLSDYANVFHQNPQSQLFKVWLAFTCVARDLWKLKLYCKYYRQKSFTLLWLFKCVLLKSTERNLQGMNGLWIVPYWSMQSKSALRDRRIHNFIELWSLVHSVCLEIWVLQSSFFKLNRLDSLHQKGC